MTTERSGMSLNEKIIRQKFEDYLQECQGYIPCDDMGRHAHGGYKDFSIELAWQTYLHAKSEAHLSRDAVVTEGDVHRFQEVYDAEWDKAVEADPGSLKGTADHKATLAALSSFAARHAAVPDEIDLTSAPVGWPNAESACYAAGWNACRQAMLASRDEVK